MSLHIKPKLTNPNIAVVPITLPSNSQTIGEHIYNVRRNESGEITWYEFSYTKFFGLQDNEEEE